MHWDTSLQSFDYCLVSDDQPRTLSRVQYNKLVQHHNCDGVVLFVVSATRDTNQLLDDRLRLARCAGLSAERWFSFGWDCGSLWNCNVGTCSSLHLDGSAPLHNAVCFDARHSANDTLDDWDRRQSKLVLQQHFLDESELVGGCQLLDRDDEH